MARQVNRLTDMQVRNITKDGLYNDGGGLHLQVKTITNKTKSGETKQSLNKSWIYRYAYTEVQPDGTKKSRERRLGLGSAAEIKLKDARRLRDEINLRQKQGIDPYEHHTSHKRAIAQQRTLATTFREVALRYIDNVAESGKWKEGGKSESRWRYVMKTYVFPVIGDMPVSEIQTKDVVSVLSPIWRDINDTASKLIGQMSAIFKYAISMNMRTDPDPADWDNRLSFVAELQYKRKSKSHPSLPHQRIPELVKFLRSKPDDIAAKCLLLIVWTGCRSAEARAATWDEFDLENGIWTAHEDRTKTSKAYVRHMPTALVELIKSVPRNPNTNLVFPSRSLTAVSETRIRKLIKASNLGHYTQHGMRNSLTDWAAEHGYSEELRKAQIGHTIGNKTDQAYLRTNFLDLRVPMMDHWVRYTLEGEPPAANVTDIKSRQAS